ncbi:Pfam:DUF894 [Seminavis robusta]|uniref:Pfam:DUF894 n=1 Tax=Seminavis robusta TaxID=568900 RepID=A0A9N8D738_9STRA|nr:Pfam:DUF894 [Seminavis robusta]|eukprot:Sro4_g003460.1 Pfam:DUF894 (518) ;mRNA; r:156212-157890
MDLGGTSQPVARDYGAIDNEEVALLPGAVDELKQGNREWQQDNILKLEATYWNLIKNNRAYRLYQISYTATLIGEWLTYIACISLIEQIQRESSSPIAVEENGTGQSRTAVSIFIVCTVLPTVLVAPFAGAWADTQDRRQAMIFLNLVGAIIPSFYLLAMQLQSLWILYVTTFLKYTVAGLHEPNMWAMLPLLATNEDFLQKATTLTELTWSVVYTLSSAAGGLVVGWFGFRTCFLVDSTSYLFSAFLLSRIGGNWKASSEGEPQKDNESPWCTVQRMTMEGIAFLQSNPCGAFVMMKTSGAIIYGACDVLAVAFSEADYGNGNDTRSASDNAARLGYLLASAGVGCIVGPLISDHCTRMDIPASHQKACILGMGVAAFSCIAMSVPSLSYSMVCLCTAIRSAGDNITAIDTSLLVQKYSPPGMLGRVTSVQTALVYLSEGLMACICGILMDRFKLDAHEAALVTGILGVAIFVAWIVFHILGGGANRPIQEFPTGLQEKTGLLSASDSSVANCQPC